MTNSEDYTYHCPECGETLTVNESMKEALVDKGCVICGADVTSAAFTPASAGAT